jgi:hypothetical protein
VADIVRLVAVWERELRAVALRLIEELGANAGLQIGLLARSPKLDVEARKRLLSVAEAIEHEHGFSWHFAGDAEASCASR